MLEAKIFEGDLNLWCYTYFYLKNVPILLPNSFSIRIIQ